MGAGRDLALRPHGIGVTPLDQLLTGHSVAGWRSDGLGAHQNMAESPNFFRKVLSILFEPVVRRRSSRACLGGS